MSESLDAKDLFKKPTSRYLNFSEKRAQIGNLEVAGDSTVKKANVRKTGMFWNIYYKIFGFQEDKEDSEVDLFVDDETIWNPRFIESQTICHHADLYKMEYNLKDIKKIYKRIINPRDP